MKVFFPRLAILKARFELWQDNQRFRRLKAKGILEMGPGSYGQPSVYHDPYSNAKVSIGNYCFLSAGIEIYTGNNHNVQWVSTYPFRIMMDIPEKFTDGHPSSKEHVEINHDVWIGKDVVILSGVHIGSGAVVAAKSVVVKDLEPYGIYGGNPAKLIRKRFSDEQIERLMNLEWWNWPKEKILKAVPLLCSEDVGKLLDEYEV